MRWSLGHNGSPAWILLLAGLVIGCETKSRPNVLLVSLDACRADRLGAYGYPKDTSPFLDELARGGTLFRHAFVNTHGTSPSHATLLTSLYQETHGVEYFTRPGELSTNPIPETALMLQQIMVSKGYVTLAVTDGGQMGRPYGFARGFHEYHDQGGGVVSGTRKMIELIRRYGAAGRPIFAVYHTYEIHSPYLPPERYLEMFDPPESSFVPTSENLLRFSHSARTKLSAADLAYIDASYDAGIRFTDDALQRMFVELERSGFLDHSLVVITSDHGEEFGEHGGLLHRGTLYDELLRVPLIVTGTRVPRGVVDERLVSSVDIAPTILDYVGVPPAPAMEGRSLWTRPRPTGRAHDVVFSQYRDDLYALRTRHWKLILFEAEGRVELYDLSADPGEQTNRADDYPDRVAAMQARLTEWRKRRRPLIPPPERDIELTEEQIRELEALGYVGRDDQTDR